MTEEPESIGAILAGQDWAVRISDAIGEGRIRPVPDGEQLKRCVCDGDSGWIEVQATPGAAATVRPCERCRPTQADRMATEAPPDQLLGSRHHLDHAAGGCDVCAGIVGGSDR